MKMANSIKTTHLQTRLVRTIVTASMVQCRHHRCSSLLSSDVVALFPRYKLHMALSFLLIQSNTDVLCTVALPHGMSMQNEEMLIILFS